MLKHINQISEQSFFIDFGSEINIEINNIVNSFYQKMLNDSEIIRKLNIKNIVPSYNKILIQFDPLNSNKSEIINFIKSIKIIKIKDTKKIKKKIIEIPICYNSTYGLDLKEISKITNLSINKLIKEHLKTLYHVYMIGFIPGLPFMGNMDHSLSLPRKVTPRIMVPKGSVGIVDKLCVIYPQDSPGGWNIIGRTPIDLFFKNKKQPLLIQPGDMIKFKKISEHQFNTYEE